jgi:hypothetical protein
MIAAADCTSSPRQRRLDFGSCGRASRALAPVRSRRGPRDRPTTCYLKASGKARLVGLPSNRHRASGSMGVGAMQMLSLPRSRCVSVWPSRSQFTSASSNAGNARRNQSADLCRALRNGRGSSETRSQRAAVTGPRSSNHSWSQPSICTSSPTQARRCRGACDFPCGYTRARPRLDRRARRRPYARDELLSCESHRPNPDVSSDELYDTLLLCLRWAPETDDCSELRRNHPGGSQALVTGLEPLDLAHADSREAGPRPTMTVKTE